MLLFVSFDGDGVHKTLERLSMQDDIAELRRLANSHADAEQRLAQWAINHGGTVIDDHNVQVPPEALSELPTEQQKYHDLTEHTLSVGVGMKLSEAKRALKISQKRGGARVTFWNPSMQDELDRADMNDASVEQLAAQFEEPTRSAITADDLKDGQLDGGTVFLKHEPLAKMSTPAGMAFFDALRGQLAENRRNYEADYGKVKLPKKARELLYSAPISINLHGEGLKAMNLKGDGRLLNELDLNPDGERGYAAERMQNAYYDDEFDVHRDIDSDEPIINRPIIERRLFGIPEDAPGSVRPLYGAVHLNHKHPLEGSSGAAPEYGNHWLELHDNVRDRSTFAGGDTYNVGITGRYVFGADGLEHALHSSANILGEGLHDDFLNHVKTGEPVGVGGDNFLEAHIHGGVYLNRDVKALHLNIGDSDWAKRHHAAHSEAIEHAVALGKKHGFPVYMHKVLPSGRTAKLLVHHPDQNAMQMGLNGAKSALKSHAAASSKPEREPGARSFLDGMSDDEAKALFGGLKPAAPKSTAGGPWYNDEGDMTEWHPNFGKAEGAFSGEQQSAVGPQKPVGPTQAQQRMADKMAAFAQQPQQTEEEAAQVEEQEQQNEGDTEKAAIAQALMAIKQQIPVLEQIKQQKPETYAAVMGLVQAMTVAVQAKLSGKPKDEGKKADDSKEEKVEKVEKAESSKHCKCEAYKFPHRHGSGSCKNKQTELKKNEDDWESVLSGLPKHPDVPDYGRLKLTGSGNHLGGAGEKSLFADEQGNQYVFRHAVNKRWGNPEPFRAAGQVAVSRLQRALKPFSPALNVEIHNGEPGVMQQFIPAKPFRWKPPRALTDIEKEDLAAEHIIDWTTSQHDSHTGNLLSTPDGRLVGIDKEQAFRWFGRDSLDHEYHPNEQYGEQEPYYNTFWRAFSNGEVDFDPRKMAPYFDKLEAFPDEEYADLLKPYARLTRRGDDFIQAAIARKNNARKDFEEFISKLYERRTGQPGRFSFATGWVHGNGGDLNKMDLTPDNKRRKTLIHKPMQMDGEEGYPVGTQIYGVGKVKVMHSDEQARGIPNPKETSWVEMRDGMIMSQDGHPISSRNANGK